MYIERNFLLVAKLMFSSFSSTEKLSPITFFSFPQGNNFDTKSFTNNCRFQKINEETE